MLSSKERLLKCIRHESIDKVPVSTYELNGWNRNAWENREPSYKKLMDEIRLRTDCIYMLNPQFRERANPDIETREWNEGNSHFVEKAYHVKNKKLTCLNRVDEGLYTTWMIKHLLEDISDIDTYLSIAYEPPEIDMTDFDREKETLGDKGLMMISVADPVCTVAELFEMGTFLTYAVTEREKIKYFLDAIHERQLYDLKNILKNDVRNVIFRICGPEYATPPYLSPGYFNDFVTCYLIEMCREIKNAGGIPRIHSHGKIGKVIDQFAMTEAEAIDPLEPLPDGDMELGDIKRLYGERFCLFGNIELKELEHSDRSRIDALIRRAMEEAKAGSGFVLMPTASPINVPLSQKTLENYLQMFESAEKYGNY